MNRLQALLAFIFVVIFSTPTFADVYDNSFESELIEDVLGNSHLFTLTEPTIFTTVESSESRAPWEVGASSTQYTALDGTTLNFSEIIIKNNGESNHSLFGLLPNTIRYTTSNYGDVDHVGTELRFDQTDLFYRLGGDSYQFVASQYDYPRTESAAGIGYILPITWTDESGIKHKELMAIAQIADNSSLIVRLLGNYSLKALVEETGLFGGSSFNNYILHVDARWHEDANLRDIRVGVKHPFAGRNYALDLVYDNIAGEENVMLGMTILTN